MEDKRKLTPATIAIFIFVLALIGLLGYGLSRQQQDPPMAGEPVPEFTLTFYDGYAWQTEKVASLAEFGNRPIVLNFWASWCAPCRLEADHLETAWRTHGDDVLFIGVAYSDVNSKALAFLDEFNITYPNAPDLGSEISDRFRITGVPETFFIDADGILVEHLALPLTAENLEQSIAKIK